AQRHAGVKGRVNGYRAYAVIAVEPPGVGHRLDADEVRQGDQLAGAGRAYVDVPHVLRRRLFGALALEYQVALLAVQHERSDALRAEHGLQRRADLLHGHAKIGGAAIVDVDAELLLRFLVVPVDLADARVFHIESVDERVPPFDERLVGRALDDELDRLAAAAEGRLHVGERPNAGDVGKLPVDVVDDLEAVAAMTPWGEDNLDRAGVEGAAGPRAAGRPHGDALDLAIVDHRQQAGFDLLDERFHVLERRAFRPVDHHLKGAAVFLRRVLAGDLIEEEDASAEDREEGAGDGDRPVHGCVVNPAVAAAHPREGGVYEVRESLPFAFRVLFVGLEQLGRHHRGDRERHQHREGDRRGDGDGEL